MSHRACPFHQEKTPSFTVDPEKGLWHCFGCKAGGDVFRFVEMTEKVDFLESVEILARRLGLQPRTPAAASQSRTKERLIALHERAARAVQLRAQKPRRFGGARVPPKTRAAFPKAQSRRSCWATRRMPGTRSSTRWTNTDSPRKELGRAGLAIERDDGGFYDRFRNRLIFPIRDATGRIIAFGGHALADDQQPKYLNSPETPLFQKGQTLWAFDLARRSMGDKGRAIVVEGYMDAIACHEAGLTETVATMGTALTAHHVELLRRRADRLVLAFDADSAGLAAAVRSSELFRQAELDVRVLTLPDGMDPDNVIRQKGPDAFRELADSAVPMIEWELGRALAQGQGGREGMAALRDAVAILSRVALGVEREYYIGWLAWQTTLGGPGQSRTTESAIRDELLRLTARKDSHGRRTESIPAQPAVPKAAEKSQRGRLTAFLLSALLQHGSFAEQFVPLLEAGDFPTPEQQAIFEAIAHLVGKGDAVSSEAVLAEVDAEARGLLAELALEDMPQEQIERSLKGSVRRIVEARLQKQQRALQQRLTQPLSEQEQEAVRRELNDVVRRKSELAAERIVGEG